MTINRKRKAGSITGKQNRKKRLCRIRGIGRNTLNDQKRDLKSQLICNQLIRKRTKLLMDSSNTRTEGTRQ